MFIKRTTRKYKGKTYHNYLLVESVATPKGPRHRVIASLGRLSPAPREEWRALAHKVAGALDGQLEFEQDARVDDIVAKVRGSGGPRPVRKQPQDVVAVQTDKVAVKQAREAGPVHVGHQIWKQLDFDAILSRAGLPTRARILTEVMTLNRLVSPASEHAMPDWVRRTALCDILRTDFDTLNDDELYRNLDRLYPQRVAIEKDLAERERTLFNLDDSIFLYDLTSTYFEGQCLANPQAKRGYARDKRPDCKQVVVGLVLNRDGFPKCHEVFDGNKQDRSSVEEMLAALEKRTGKHGGSTVVVDRGMAYDENLQQIKDRHHHYIVASRQAERNAHIEEFEDEADWHEMVRNPSPRNPAQKKSRVLIKRSRVGDEVHILCRSEGRTQKDRAIREKHEVRLLRDLKKLEQRIAKGRLVADAKIHEAIGRLKERHFRVARYYEIKFDGANRVLTWKEDAEKKERAVRLDGAYLLKTDRQDLTDDDVWRTYMLLTRVESAFRSMKSPLAERPIFHQLKHRVQTHIFLCVLAYHLLVAIEKRFLDAEKHTSWETLREQLTTHQVVSVVLPEANGRVLEIRKGTVPEAVHQDIYRTLRVPEEIMKPIRTYHDP